MKRLFAVLFLLPAIAWAQPQTSETPADQVASASISSSPSQSPLCAYPKAVLAARVEGSTALTFDVNSAGIVSNVAIHRSSGNSDLDAAAISCVSQLRSESVGAAHAGEIRATVVWKISPPVGQGSSAFGQFLLGWVHSCVMRMYPPNEWRAKIGGIARVRFNVLTDGTVSDPEIIGSTGSVALDRATIRCVQGWHYLPATRDGQPVEAQQDADIIWDPAAQ